jgi:hypothetical protein
MSTTDTTLGNPLPQARQILKRVEELGELKGEEKLQAEAVGINLGGLQRQYMLHAATLALVSIAESLEALVAGS